MNVDKDQMRTMNKEIIALFEAQMEHYKIAPITLVALWLGAVFAQLAKVAPPWQCMEILDRATGMVGWHRKN